MSYIISWQRRYVNPWSCKKCYLLSVTKKDEKKVKYMPQIKYNQIYPTPLQEHHFFTLVSSYYLLHVELWDYFNMRNNSSLRAFGGTPLNTTTVFENIGGSFIQLIGHQL